MTTSVGLLIDRGYLGKDDLDLNSGGYKVAAGSEFFGGPTRSRAISSPWVEGEMEIDHVYGNVPMVVAVECRGDTPVAVQALVADLAEAVIQPRYTMKLTLGTGYWEFACFPAADRQVDYSRERLHASQILVACTIPRLPRPLIGSLL